ncbi:dipeptidyl-peptidase IV [Clostridium beijerinckii]|uniref:Dipeptidyl-peptidase IV n=1 Tax=Clostridium beijerinckii TaxID=1520 RepID=A0A7X9XQL9_CLOBE|nr:dipeptidyl-peptidase IV [Clostridium beijerinckii]NMF06737.1 dipeptidyl-peptidase IV [Clostridium beijerinckii]
MKKLIVWATLALMLEVSLLYILNNFVFKNSSEFNSKKIEVKKNSTDGINVTIPSNIENIDLSYEGKYLTYFKGKKLYIQDTRTGKVSEINTEDNETIMYYRWLEDRDLIAIVENIKKDGKEKVQLITYNPSSFSKTLVKEICKYKKNMVVNNMTTSVLTNVFYINMNNGNSGNKVYRIDRNEELTNIDIKASSLGNMQVIPHEDRLIYEDKINNKFFITSPNKQLIFNSNKKLALLSIDKKDVIYIGEINGDKISSIFYGKVNEDTSTWNKVTLDSSVDKKDLYFSNESEILINDNLKGEVRNITTGKKIEYEGKLIKIKDEFIAIMDNNGKLVYKSLK